MFWNRLSQFRLFAYLLFKFILGHFLRYFDGIIPGKARRTESALRLHFRRCQRLHAFYAQISQRICSDMRADLRNGHLTSDQIFLAVDVHAEMTWVGKRRTGNSHMYFRCTRLTQQIDDPLAGRATHDAVVYQDHSLSGNDTLYNIQLDPHGIGTHLLIGLNKRSAHIAVFDKTDFIRDMRSLRQTQGRIQAAVRNTDDNICIYRMFLPQQLAGTDSGIVYGTAVDDRVPGVQKYTYSNTHRDGF